ncbi:TlpA family protein disulfide reductase [Acidobacteria bacterium AH-259-D05]|nr:TlpA family protein disulfide reductase [Acidobacteria bacterium AH-259-D05]
MNPYQSNPFHKIFPTVALLMLGVLLIVGCGQPVEYPVETIQWLPEEDRQAMDLSGTFKTLEGEDVPLLDSDGESTVLFLNIWATWCAPCLEEMPSMASLHEELSEQGLSMIAVSDEDPETVRQFLEEHPYPFTILLDPENILGQRFEVMAIPSTFIVDRQGRLALRHTGAYFWNSAGVMEQFRPLLTNN